jgi:hypothetical protein
MGFISWIVNKRKEAPAGKVEPPQPTEYAKQKGTREAFEEEQNRKLLTPEIKADAADAGRVVKRYSETLVETVKPSAPESGGSPSALLQKQDGQEKVQAALSPTDGTKGKPVSVEKPKPPEKKPERPRTLPRTPPSWER